MDVSILIAEKIYFLDKPTNFNFKSSHNTESGCIDPYVVFVNAVQADFERSEMAG